MILHILQAYIIAPFRFDEDAALFSPAVGLCLIGWTSNTGLIFEALANKCKFAELLLSDPFTNRNPSKR